MKKESFLGLLCTTAGIVVAIILTAFLFKTLHWPGGTLLSTIITPILLLIQAILMLCYIPKHGALKVLTENGNCIAKHLLNIEISALVFAILLAIGLLFRGLHYPGAGVITMISCCSLCIMSLIAGFLGCKLVNKK